MWSPNATLRRVLALALVAALPVAFASPADAKRVHKLKLTTHVDPKPKKGKKRFRPSARTAALATTWGCDETTSDRASYLSNAPQIKVIYAYAGGATDNLSSYGDMIQADAAAVADKVAAESANTKSVRFDVGGSGGAGDVCTNDARNRLDIQTFHLAQDASYYTDNTFAKVLGELIQSVQPADPNQRVNYVVYLDNVHPPLAKNVAGQADFADAHEHGYDNPINQGRNGRGDLFAVIYGYGGSDFNNGLGADERRVDFLHELSHTLGAVQLNAPHSSGAAHCYDGADVMCYADGGPYFTNGGSMTFDCGGSGFTVPLDCNNDDYFDASPAPGTFLATNWNEYDSVFLCPVAECDSELPAFPVSLTQGRDGRQLTVTADTGGVPIEHYEWNTDNDPIFETDTGTSPVLTTTFEAAGAKKVELRAVKADGSFAYGTITLTARVPVPSLVVSGTRVVGAPITLDASGTSDPDGLIQHYRWDLDSNSIFESDTGLTPVATTSYSTAGTKIAGLMIDYGFGFTQTFTRFDIGSTTAPPADGKPAPPSISVLRIRLAKLLKSGLPLSVRCNAQCRTQFTLSIDAKTAKRFHLKGSRGKPVVIGRVRGQFVAGTVKPVIQLSASAKKALRKARSLKVVLKGSIAQTGVKTLAVNKALLIRR